jgi:hypothetical protein
MVVPRLTPTYLQVGDLQIKNVCRAGRCAQEKLVFPHVGSSPRLHADEAKSHDNYITDRPMTVYTVKKVHGKGMLNRGERLGQQRVKKSEGKPISKRQISQESGRSYARSAHGIGFDEARSGDSVEGGC